MKKNILSVILLFASFMCASAYMPFSPRIDQYGQKTYTKSGYLEGYVITPVAGQHELYVSTKALLNEKTGKIFNSEGEKFSQNDINEYGKILPGAHKHYSATYKTKEFFDCLNFYAEDLNNNENTRRVWRPDLFKQVMGIDEALFWEYVFTDGCKRDKKGVLQVLHSSNALKRFPILQTVVHNIAKDVRTTIDLQPVNDVEKLLQAELRQFPERAALLSSRFECKTIGQLRTEFFNQVQSRKFGNKAPGSIDLIDGYAILQRTNNLELALRSTDIRYLMARQTDVKTAYMIASNFDTLEGGRNALGKHVSGMQYRATQGENAALSGIAQALIRKLYINLLHPQFNLLQNLSDTIDVRGGRVKKIRRELGTNDMNAIMIAHHHNVAITSGYYPTCMPNKQLAHQSGLPFYPSRQQFMYDHRIVVNQPHRPLNIFNGYIDHKNNDIRVDQIFTAALDLGDRGIKEIGVGHEQSAQVILNAEYLGTILSAALNGCDELYLTLLGGGAFKNSLESIMQALSQPEIINALTVSGMRVHVIIYPDFMDKKTGHIKKMPSCCDQRLYATVFNMNNAIRFNRQPVQPLIYGY